MADPLVGYAVLFEEEAKKRFDRLDKPIRVHLLNKIAKLADDWSASRHLGHGSPYFVEEAGGFRIAFKLDGERKTKTIAFVGDHKEYERWYSGK